MLESIERFFGAIRARIDVLNETVSVWAEADDVLASAGPGRSLSRWDATLDGDPIFQATFDEIDSAYGYLCEPRPGAGCRGAELRLGCPLPRPCAPMADLREKLEENLPSDTEIGALSFTLAGVRARWLPQEAPPPVLVLTYNIIPDLDIIWYGNIYVDVPCFVSWWLVSWDFPIIFRVGDDHCSRGPCPGPGLNEGPPRRVWDGFFPETPYAAAWTSKNMRIETASPGLLPGLRASLDSDLELRVRAWVYVAAIVFPYLWPLIQGVEEDLDRAERLIHGSLQTSLYQLHKAAIAYLTLWLPESGTELITEDFFDLQRGLPEERAPTVALRFSEASAGASKAFWDMLTAPFVAADEATGATFEIVGLSTAADPTTGQPCLMFEAVSDLDCDTVPDDLDGCPTYCNTTETVDSDGDTISDFCDLCAFSPRADLAGALPRRSFDYNRGPGDGPGVVRDSDGDDVGDRCDLCPRMSRYELPGAPRTADEATIPAEGGASTSAGGTRPHGYDADRDGIGDRCDNCPNDPNRDQWNCNAADELFWGILAEPPTPAAKGIGDACDWRPCVDSCGVASVEGKVEPEIDVPSDRDERWFLPTDEEPLTAFVCPVGSVSDVDRRTATLRTTIRGCYCDRAEYRSAEAGTNTACFDTHCRDNGDPGGRWTDAAFDTRAGEFVEYTYSRAYSREPALGLAGRRFDRSGLHEYYRPAGSTESTDRVTEQEWNWISQPEFPAGMKYVRMWFKPAATPGRFDGYARRVGNTYSGWKWVNPVGAPLPPGAREPPPVGGGVSITSPWVFDEDGRFSTVSSPLLDLLERWCYAAGCWGWPDRLFFDDQPDTNAVGLAVSGFDPSSDRLSWVTGTKLAPGAVFDLRDFAAAFAYDANREPNRFWTFGGRDAAGLATDQMWAAQLAVVDELGTKTYVGPEGLLVPLSNGPLPEGTTAFFEAAPVRASGVWPSERFGATLVCAGTSGSPATTPGWTCDGFCPNVDVALGLEVPPDGTTRAAGRLLLVGGEASTGPLDDIWVYDERATWKPPSDVSPGETGPWPSGWSLAGILPGAGEGLAHAGSVQVGRTLWLVGGRNLFGPTADLFRIDLDTGHAERFAAGVGGPAPRIAPAVGYDGRRNALVVFGGTDASGRPLADLWSFDLTGGVWSRLAARCDGAGCPPATGRETLYLHPFTRDPTVVANRTTATATSVSWTLRDGVWESAAEGPGGSADCDGDTAPEALFGARCATGSGGFPDYGRLRCAGGRLACRPPAAPGAVAWEQRVPGVRALVRNDANVLALAGNRIEEYRFEPDGYPALERTIRLRRAGHDLTVTPRAIAVADDGGLSIYSERDGAFLASVEACGRVRRVFAEGSRAIAVGLRSVLTVDLSEPARPVVLGRFRLVPLRDRLAVLPCGDCGWLDRGIDRLCDVLGACGAFGRSAAAYADHRLFVELFGVLYVLEFRGGVVPEVAGAVPIGLATELVAEGRFVYANLAGRRTAVAARTADGAWVRAGAHDVPVWVEGVVDARQ